MATGSGIPQQGGIVTSDITPTYSVPHDNAIATALGHAGDAAQGLINNAIERHYQKVGADEGAAVAAGLKPYKDIPVITDVGRARQAAFQGSYLATIKSDIDTHIDDTVRANPLDPASYKAAVDPIVSGYAKGAPGPFAVQVQSYATAKAAEGFNKLSDQKTQHDQVRAVAGVNARQQTLSDNMLALASAGQDNTPEYKAAHDEWTANNVQKVANPLFEFAPEQAAAAADKMDEALQGAVLTRHATSAYTAAGGGEAGKAAALLTLKTEALDDGGALKDMAPAKRLKLYGVAAANINDMDKYDAEVRRQQAEADRAKRADQREAAGTLALGLTDGSVSEADIHQAEKLGQIEPGSAARLIMGARAQARQAASQARVAASAERTANYGALSELAESGQLTPQALTANGANLTSMQRLAIGARIDRKLGPGIKNITGLASAAFKDGGIQGAAAKLALENLNADAAVYMKNNPAATVGQQTAFASDWIKKNKGLVVSPTMTPPNAAVQTKAQYSAAYRARFHGQTVNQGDIDAGWARYKSVHPTAR